MLLQNKTWQARYLFNIPSFPTPTANTPSMGKWMPLQSIWWGPNLQYRSRRLIWMVNHSTRQGLWLPAHMRIHNQQNREELGYDVHQLQKQITELVEKLVKQMEEILQLWHAISNLTEAQTHNNNKPLSPAAPEQSRESPETTQAHPTPHAKPKHTPQQWRVCTPAHPIHHNNAKSLLILDVIIPHNKQVKGQAVVSTVNSLLSYGLYCSCINAILYSKRGQPIMIASKGHNAESLRSSYTMAYLRSWPQTNYEHTPTTNNTKWNLSNGGILGWFRNVSAHRDAAPWHLVE